MRRMRLNTKYNRRIASVFIFGAILVLHLFSTFHNRSLNRQKLHDGIALTYNEDDQEYNDVKLDGPNGKILSNCRQYWKDGYNKVEYVDGVLQLSDKKMVMSRRIYNQCYLKEFGERQNDATGILNICNPELEKSIYPYISQKSPKIRSTLSNEDERDLFKLDHTQCFLTQLKQQLSGKGVILTASDFHFRELTSLILLLRALEVDLPIQLIHRGDISEFFIEKLLELATSDFEGNNHIMQILRWKYDSNVTRISFPKLKLSFVDISPAISKEYTYQFSRFSNKLLAYLFNSFSEVILIDVDTIPFIPLQDFFRLEEYLKTGTYFFKDRSLLNGHNPDDISIFLDLMPTSNETELYGINQVTDFTLKQHFLDPGFSHLMESGLVVINRLEHFESPLMALTLSQLKNTVMDKVYGDKELYWLSMSISGDESYFFNGNFAASIGEISPSLSHSHFPNSDDYKPNLKELCSNHPAHISSHDNHTLLWMNTGFKYCKKVMHIDESNPLFKGWSFDEIDEYSRQPLKIRSAIIPPIPKKPNVLANVPSSIPGNGWIARGYCESYTLCAYNIVDDMEGTVVDFDDQETDRFDYLGYVWNSPIKVLKVLQDMASDNSYGS